MSSSQQLLPTYCVIVVCGIPGSGKSKLTRWLCSACQDQKIPSHVLSFDDFELPTDDWDAESFMRSRSSSFEALENMLHQHKRGLIFVDDIMFYKSMRKRVYQLARQCEADFATIHVDVPFEVAVSRNNSRPDGTRVQEKVYTSLQLLLTAVIKPTHYMYSSLSEHVAYKRTFREPVGHQTYLWRKLFWLGGS